MLVQEQTVNVNAILYQMWEKITNLTAQLKELQASQSAGNIKQKFNKKVKANWDIFANDFDMLAAECYTANHWATWNGLKVEIEKYFKPQAERDWAHQQICSFKQGNMRTDDFITRFLALSIQGGLGNEQAIKLLECNVNHAIAKQLYLQDMRSNIFSTAGEEVYKIGRALEPYKMQFGGGPTTKNKLFPEEPWVIKLKS
ncbi:hypothetical protein SERLADRAFT_433913 [Serpula lacrymans var. lacrymans S7.9]|uniref:Retrotransposon gag domain-containing protein n=1 Tax=Serpula lacrymans var. lacrymans (strain S7.9) TaxID=578457 RepID=F8NIQ7_SERL9|nr:uncharacterized protein SERLADRAFT_433913 [Serpula lacrymans var. lacrymans S7.9]EGO29972.1 hypothetical protein SERLADRAFT_433913 [Serpula lacrymans var. lacrymans S7.9]